MKAIFSYGALVLVLVLAAPFFAHAQEVAGYVYDVELIPESVESVLELVNLLIAIVAAAFAIKLAALSQGGSLEKTWNLLAVAAVIFAALEVVGALQGYKIAHFGGLGDIIELVFLVILTTVFARTRKALLKQVLSK